MAVTDKTKDKRTISIILVVLGIIFIIIGMGRGSGLGTLSIVAGLVLLVIGVYMIATKRS